MEFFVWDGERYVQAAHPGAERLVNYFLYSQEGVVVCLDLGEHAASAAVGLSRRERRGVLLHEAHIPLSEGERNEYERIGLLLGQP